MKAKTIKTLALMGLFAASFALPAFAQEHTSTDIGTLDQETAAKVFPAKPPYSPYAGRNFPTRPFFGDTHTHTSFSFDAGAFGCRLGPKDAYRFAKGEEITASSGQQVKLSRPLDFLVVSDHSDQMGFFPTMVAGDPKVRRLSQLGIDSKPAYAASESAAAYAIGSVAAFWLIDRTLNFVT